MNKIMYSIVITLLIIPYYTKVCYADTAATYRQAVQMAAQGDDRGAQARLQAMAGMLPAGNFWRQRAVAAEALITMRMTQQTLFPARVPASVELQQSGPNQYMALASAYASEHQLLPEARRWPAILLAVMLPGAGHAWQGRWRDAGMAAAMVWPMLFLTVWAAKRRMGPVTLFFALITLWLWSGTIFSSMSLAERANAESYMAWWQGVWQASGLPGRPW